MYFDIIRKLIFLQSEQGQNQTNEQGSHFWKKVITSGFIG